MSREHVARYRRMLGELLAERRRAGGALSEEREWELIGKLSDTWLLMTADEREAFEREPARRFQRACYRSKRWLKTRVALPRWGWIALSIVIGCSVGVIVQ